MSKIKLNETIGYRPANQQDVELAYQIKSKSLKPYVEQIWGWNEQFQAKAHQERFNCNAVIFVLYNGLEVGFYELARRNNIITLANILIIDQYQSKGIGKIVMDKVCQEVEAQKCSLQLQVFKINTRAQQFYKRNGFRKIGETPHHHILERVLATPTQREK